MHIPPVHVADAASPMTVHTRPHEPQLFTSFCVLTTWPQDPQLFGSVFVLTSHPLLATWSQSAKPEEQDAIPQVDSKQ
jgi:hypothetical protein